MKTKRRYGQALLLLAGVLPVWAWAQQLPAAIDERTGITAAAPAQDLDWARMSPAQRAELRARYQAWKALDETSRSQLRQAQARWAGESAAEREQLQQHFDGMDRLYQDGWRLGPLLGRYYPQLQPLLGYVSPVQRDALLAMLRQLDEASLQRLATLSQRTPPQQREPLLQQLLGLSAAARPGWLQHQVGH